MHRTQIYLDDKIYTYLEMESKKTNRPLSEIIRANIKKNIENDVDSMIAKMNKAAGAWADNSISPDKYLRKIRKDRNL